MNDMQDTNDGDFDDHEPGDVNGNLDPAFARRQKQQARNEKRPARTPKPPRNAGAQGAPGAVADAGAPSSAPQQGRSEGNAEAPASGDGAPGAVENAGEAQSQQRARGPRRNRRGNRGRNAQQGNRGPRPEGEGPVAGGDAGAEFVASEAGEGVEPGVDGDASPRGNPNPGAFGDPNRPMDRAARRNRNRRTKRESGRGTPRAPQFSAPQLDEEGNPLPLPEDAAISGVNELGERDGERLHKVLAQQGLGSRRDMEALIEAGEVEVNGVKARVGQVVNEKDRVHVKRRKVTVKLGDDNPRILVYHKQSGEIVTRDDPEQRDTVFDRLPKPDHGKWIAIGRLDFNSEGLLLFTTYGELANRFMHPRYEILREYSVRVLGELTPEQEDQLMDGIELEDGPARFLSLDRIDRDSDSANHWYRITLNEGRNREVRRMFEHLGLQVSRLIRISYGCVQMPSWLKRGQFKQLDEAETFNVLESVGLRSKKKLEKAARFGGRNKLPQQPLGPMRSATEHEAIWTGAPADTGMGQNRRGRNAAGGQGGRNGRGRNANAPAALTQQQFPGFGGATEMQPAGRKQRTPGNKINNGNKARGQGRGPRGNGGDVDGNVAPGYKARSNNGNNGNGGGNAGGGNGGGGGNAANKRGRRRRGRGPAGGGGAGGARTEGAAPAAPMPDFE